MVDASLIAVPKQRNSEDDKTDIKAGKIPQDWKKKPAKLRQKDRDGRWTVKFGKAKEREDGSLPRDIAIPHFAYKANTGIDKRYRFSQTWDATDASRYDGRMLRQGLLEKTNTGRSVWADTAYRSKKNEAFMEKHGFVSQIHYRKPKDKPMPIHISQGDATKSKHPAPIEHVFAYQKNIMGLSARTVGLERAKMKIGLANIFYNMHRLVQLDRMGVA